MMCNNYISNKSVCKNLLSIIYHLSGLTVKLSIIYDINFSKIIAMLYLREYLSHGRKLIAPAIPISLEPSSSRYCSCSQTGSSLSYSIPKIRRFMLLPRLCSNDELGSTHVSADGSPNSYEKVIRVSTPFLYKMDIILFRS